MVESTLALRLRLDAQLEAILEALDALKIGSIILLEESKEQRIIPALRAYKLAEVANFCAQAIIRANTANYTDWDSFARSINLSEEDYLACKERSC